jgi:hypothetical protein
MRRPDHEPQDGALDDALTAQEREIDHLLSTLGPADAPPDLVDAVLARISPRTHTADSQPVVHQFVRRSVPKRGVTVNKKIIFALAAAAVVVLAVITYTSRPATTGTEATIGTAQRAQTPQIASKDVGLGDQSGQELLQSDTWDAIMKDEDLQATLHDAEARKMLEDADVRKALESDEVRRALLDPELMRWIKTQLSASKKAALTESEARNINSAAARAALRNEHFARALRNDAFARALLNARAARALSGDAMARAVRDQSFARALANPRFGEELARKAKK